MTDSLSWVSTVLAGLSIVERLQMKCLVKVQREKDVVKNGGWWSRWEMGCDRGGQREGERDAGAKRAEHRDPKEAE